MHLSPVLQEFDLGFQVYLKTLFYSSLNFPDHVFYIFCGCISCVNNKSAMLLRHFGSPYGISAKSGLHNQLSRKMSRGALKCAACAGILQRLFFPAPFRQISHFLCDLFRISLFQAESHLRHHKRLVLDHTGPIGSSLLRRRLRSSPHRHRRFREFPLRTPIR